MAATGGTQTASGGAGGAPGCGGPVTETRAAALCAQASPGTSVMVIADADCGETVFSSDTPTSSVTPVSAAAPDAGFPDAGLPPIASISVNVFGVGEIQLANPGATGIPAGSQPVVPAGDGSSLVVGVANAFNIAKPSPMQFCRAESGDVDVTLPSTLTGVGFAVSFTAHCQRNATGTGTNAPADTLVGCFRVQTVVP